MPLNGHYERLSTLFLAIFKRFERISLIMPDRKAETASAWMSAHPEIDFVSRDRSGEYASAVTIGAPQAAQCADKFHLLKNLRESLEGCLARHLAVKRQKNTQQLLDEPSPAWRETRSPKLSPKVEQLQRSRREGALRPL